MRNPELIGLILAGGKSSRMGTEKAMLEYHGTNQLSYLFSMLTVLCPKVMTSCRPEQKIPNEFNLLYDTCTGEGPMTGVLSAMKAFPGGHILAVAIDMPEAGLGMLQELLAHRSNNMMATCFINPETNRPEPLPAVFESHCMEALASQFESGNQSIRSFLESNPVNRIGIVNPEMLLNINTPAEREDYLERSQRPGKT